MNVAISKWGNSIGIRIPVIGFKTSSERFGKGISYILFHGFMRVKSFVSHKHTAPIVPAHNL